MLDRIKQQLQEIIKAVAQESFGEMSIPEIEFEAPAEKVHGDLSCNLALRSAKLLRKNPMQIAEAFVTVIRMRVADSPVASFVVRVEAKNPGFINFFLSPSAFFSVVEDVLGQGATYGKSEFGKNEKIQVEFVSANPTGPLSVAHARQAAVGDALVNILNWLGFDAKKEYYVNDGGNQIRILGQSIRLRAMEILGAKVDFPEDCYQGDYIKDMSRIFIERQSIRDLEGLSVQREESFMAFGRDYLLNVNKCELHDFGVHFDVWSHESQIATRDQIEKLLEDFAAKGLTYEKDGAVWFRSTDFGDDKDRVVRKSDGTFTYLTPDIVYHKNKFDRGFSRVFNILGPDHHGYIPRLKAAAQALGKSPDAINVLIVQLATIYRDGQILSMSTRKGQYITLREVLEEVGCDAARFFFLMRHIKAHLEFDLDLAKKETAENPVYYVQYAHARIHSINEKAREANIGSKMNGFSLFKEAEEIDLIKKIGEFELILNVCYEQMDPFALVNYLIELAIVFHRFYDRHRIITDDKELSAERLGLVNAARIILANGLRLVGVRAPEQM